MNYDVALRPDTDDILTVQGPYFKLIVDPYISEYEWMDPYTKHPATTHSYRPTSPELSMHLHPALGTEDRNV